MSVTLSVCGVAEVPRFANADLTDIVSIGDPFTHPHLCAGQAAPDFTAFPNTKVHRFEFQDICHSAATSPKVEDVVRLIYVIDSILVRPEGGRVLFHCQAGMSRSTAAAFIMCVRSGMDYQSAYDTVLRARGMLIPNLLMIKYADDLLGHQGKMLEFIARERDKLSLTGEPDGTYWVEHKGWEVTT